MLEPFDIQTEVRFSPKLGINIFLELFLDLGYPGSADLGQVFLEGSCLKDPVLTQSGHPS